ncbi:pyridoxamine 5'-phosphate oxidase family protein [Rhizobium sp. CFBP 8762]|uniref:pyridoxamine 5'-phosphate oxidase family protein n=1 Tax=Rhizobium sp. CFBP 8762 TaxID=2775279 RepID=UPI00177CFB4A|nr:pyridoxamine 5'-phosphate oxidase family protein [Rhizobium sp. CFBP 8762]MBD8556680.1 pyridoxamine 5'-phosphate oxidase family protein [Rhizobium sp. CFBP 8762]
MLTELTPQECVDFVNSASLGHLACAQEGQPYSVPVRFACEYPYLYSFSMPGQKIEWMRANPQVCLSVLELKSDHDWRSVIVTGRFEELPDTPELHTTHHHAWTLLQSRPNWWEPGAIKPDTTPGTTSVAPVFYRIHMAHLTGRRSSPS